MKKQITITIVMLTAVLFLGCQKGAQAVTDSSFSGLSGHSVIAFSNVS